MEKCTKFYLSVVENLRLGILYQSKKSTRVLTRLPKICFSFIIFAPGMSLKNKLMTTVRAAPISTVKPLKIDIYVIFLNIHGKNYSVKVTIGLLLDLNKIQKSVVKVTNMS